MSDKGLHSRAQAGAQTKKRRAKPAVADQATTVGAIAEILRQYDRAQGQFPEHEYEGKSVGAFVLHALGCTYADADKLLGIKGKHFSMTRRRNSGLYRTVVDRDDYDKAKPGNLRL